MTSDDKKIKPKPDQKNDAPPKEKGVQETAPSEPSGGRKERPTHPLAIAEAKAKSRCLKHIGKTGT